jgi:hypothetical protein
MNAARGQEGGHRDFLADFDFPQNKPEQSTARATKRFAAQALTIVFTAETKIPTARIPSRS